jgi:hypothetical protein
MNKLSIITILLISFLSGCASIVGQPTQLLPISSSPDGASITITDEKGFKVFEGTSPAAVSLEKSDGTFWGGKSFTVTIKKVGYDSISLPVTTQANGWYIGGNLVFGGLIGWFIVDPQSGNMYSLSTKSINASLNANNAKASANKNSISLVLLENVPSDLKSELVKLN